MVRDSAGEAEHIAWEISRRFEALAGACANRSLNAFPTDIVQQVVDLCNNLKSATPQCSMPASYVEHVRTNRDVLGYLRESEARVDAEELRIVAKRRVFGMFRAMLEEMEM